MSIDLTEREAARIGPRELKQPGSKPWVYQTLNGLRYDWQRLDLTLEEWETTINELREYKAWEALGYTTLDELLQVEIGRTLKESVVILSARAVELQGHGGDRKSTLYHNIDFPVSLKQQGDSAEYLTARIARDRPDILERMKQGAYTSVRQAALDAGIVAPRISIPTDPTKAARVLRRHFTTEQIHELIDALTHDA